MAVTISDIAKKASVSVGTVSHVLNNRPSVGSERKQRVLAAIEELDFQPNRWARRMAKGQKNQQTGQIAMVFLNLSEWVKHAFCTLQYIQGAQQEIADSGRECLFLTWNEKPGDDTVPHTLLNGEIDGIIVKGEPQSETSKYWLSRFTRVWLNPGNNISSDDCDCIMVDYQTGIRNTIAYLASRGHRRIAIVSPEDTLFFPSKLTGYKQAVKELGLDVDDELIQVRNILPEYDCGWAVDNLWSLSKPPTAILSNDYSCSGIYKALIARGLNIPQDVSVVGYEGSLEHCEALVPRLTSMNIGSLDIGKAAARQLFERIKNPQEYTRKLYIQGRMVERESVRKL
ncbi:MAG: LacI family transcriptional regulator [Phycisphaerae bacterium]|nr:LacI family transcriptional regulator [Phycisphaerae bacterium]